MSVLSIILLVLFIIVALLLIFLVAIQDEQSVGLGGIFGGSSDSAFGSGSSSFTTKATTILAVAFLILALCVALTNKTGDSGLAERAQQQTEAGTTWLESAGGAEGAAAEGAAIEAETATN